MPTLKTKPELLVLPDTGLGQQWLGEEEQQLVQEVLKTKKLFRYSFDPEREAHLSKVANFEKEFGEKMGTKYALAVTSGTAALEVALGALGIGAGDEVIVPAYSWTSCFTSIVRSGALPVLAEIDETLCLDPTEIRRRHTPRTKAVMVIHYQGVSADMDRIVDESNQMGIAVIEDCAEATGATFRGKRLGSLGNIGTFSLQNNKVITSGDGGIIVTNDPRLYERAVRMHDIGLFRPHHRQFLPEHREIPFSGGQYRMNELTGAVALAQTRKLDKLIAHIREMGCRIRKALLEHPQNLELRKIPDPEGDIPFEAYCYLATPELAARFGEALRARGSYAGKKLTGTTCHYFNEYCRQVQTASNKGAPFEGNSAWPERGWSREDFPRTEELVNRSVAISIGSLFSFQHIDQVIQAIHGAHDDVFGG